MVPSLPHSIQRQYVEADVAGSEADALAVQRRLAAVCAQSLRPAVERALDRRCPPHGVVRIDRLDVDVGSIALDSLETQLPALLERCLHDALEAHLAGSEGCEGAPSRHVSLAESLDEALAHFLRYGTLPATLRLSDGADFEATLMAAWESVRGTGNELPDSAGALSGAHAPPAPALVDALRTATAGQRLASQFSPAFQLALLARLARAPAQVLEASLQHLKTIAQGTSLFVAARLLCRAAWQLALDQHRGAATTPPGVALQRSMPELAARAALAAVAADARDQGGQATASDPAAPGRSQERGERPPSGLQSGEGVAAYGAAAASHPDREEGIYIGNAGLVLLHPFIPRLFEALGVSRGGQLLQPGRALALLHFLASGRLRTPEHELALPKLLCELPLTAGVQTDVSLDAEERSEADAMLTAAIGHWAALRDTSPDGLRGAFLLRPGKLSIRAGEWLLQVEPQGVDILLRELPWAISAVRLPWMTQILWVEWAS